MQENPNFETIITTWRRLSGELQTDSALPSMSGDSDHHHKRRDEEPTLLVPDKVKPTPAPNFVTTGTIAAEAAITDSVASTSPNEKTEFIQHDSKEATGDSNDKDEKEYLDNKDSNNVDAGEGECKYENKFGDKVDSVYLRPPPPHKVRSTTSTANDEEDCGIKCLYYTLQCCDCVLM